MMTVNLVYPDDSFRSVRVWEFIHKFSLRMKKAEMENYMKRKKSEDEKLSAKRKHPIDPDAMYMFVDIVLSLSCKPTKRERERKMKVYWIKSLTS